MSRASFVRTYRVAGAGLIVVALGYIIWDRGGSDTFSLADFFSYFTVLSNCIAAVVLAVEGLWPGRDTDDRWQMVRGAAVLYMAITGVVYAVLLSDIDVQTPGFSNTVLHQVMPVVMVLDWLFEPPWVRLRFERALAWLVFPLLYLVYTLIRGPIADWYPYPFIDPDRHGYGRVAGNCVGIAAGFVAVTWLLTWAGNRLGDRSVSGISHSSEISR